MVNSFDVLHIEVETLRKIINSLNSKKFKMLYLGKYYFWSNTIRSRSMLNFFRWKSGFTSRLRIVKKKIFEKI